MWLTTVFCVTVLLYYSEVEAHFMSKNCLTVRGKTHKKEVLAMGLNRPYQLSSYKPEHEIYFSVNVGEDTKDSFQIAYIKKNMVIMKLIEGIENGFATAVDEATHTVYFGGSDGIYKKELKGKDTNLTRIVENVNVWDMFFKHHLYFVRYPSQKLYKYTGKDKKIEHEKWVHEKIYQFAIDGDDDVFITNDTGLYLIKNHTHRHLFHGEKEFRAIAVNNKGEAHFAGKNAIYVPHKHNYTLHKIADIPNIFGITFDPEDNIVYSDPHEIIKVIPDDKCRETPITRRQRMNA